MTLTWLCACVTFISKDPSFVHAGDEEDRRLGETHEEVRDSKVNDENVGWGPQTPAPAHTNTQLLKYYH